MQPPKVLPPHYFVLTILLMALSELFWPVYVISGWVVYLGLLPMAIGFILAVCGARQFKAAGTNIIPLTKSSVLVEDGVFKYSRNPMYTGMLLFLAGLGWLLGNVIALAMVAVFFVIIRQQFVLKEEQLMAATFPQRYTNYRSQVRRWW